MDAVLVFSIHGLWCLDEDLAVIAQTKFGKTAEEAAASLGHILNGEHDPTVEVFLAKVEKKNIDRFFAESLKIAEDLTRLYNVKAVFYEDVTLWRRVRKEVLGPQTSLKTYPLLHDVAVLVSREIVREASEQKDQLVVQSMNALDDIEKTQNLIASRLREWYGLHYPEASHKIDDPMQLAKIIVEGGTRNQIQGKPELVELLPKTAARALQEKQSMGASIGDHDMVMIQALGQQYLDLHQLRGQLEKYLDEAMRDIAPNLRGLIGPVIGARLIGLVGNIEKLARLPASTIQVLGAERALFRALKTGARPPKHGVIFQHTLVHSAPWWQRGKIARILAGKIAIAVRVDLYSGEYVADELKQSVMTRIAEVRRKYPTPPKTPPPKKRPRVQKRVKGPKRKPPDRGLPKRKKKKHSRRRSAVQ